MNSEFEKLGVPIVLIGSLWSAMDVVLSAFKEINERRDLITDLIDKCGKCDDCSLTPAIVYWTNLFPLSAGVIIFLAIMTVVSIKMPAFANLLDQDFAAKLERLARLIALPLLIALLGFVAGCLFDFYYFIVQDRV